MGEQILRNSAALLRVTFYADGVAVDADGTVTVAVTREDGTALTSGNATNDVTAVGAYTFVLPAQANLDVLTVTWSGAFSGITQTVTTYADVVGAFFVSLAEIRSQKNLADTAKFSTDELAEARDVFASTVEDFCGVSFVPRYQRDVLDGTSTASVWLSRYPVRSIIAATVDGTAVADITGWGVYDYGKVVADATTFTASTVGRNVTVKYEHGLDGPPADLKRAALIAIRASLLDDQTGHRETSIINEFGGTTRLAVVNEDNPTGIPAVDGVLRRYRERYRVPAIA